MPVTVETIEAFVSEYQAKFAARDAENHPGVGKSVVGYEIGRRYARIFVRHGDAGGRYALGFVDLTSGDLLKADGWKGPAKGVRGNIHRTDRMERANIYGGIA